MHVNFISFKDTREIRSIYVWSDNAEIRSGNETGFFFSIKQLHG